MNIHFISSLIFFAILNNAPTKTDPAKPVRINAFALIVGYSSSGIGYCRTNSLINGGSCYDSGADSSCTGSGATGSCGYGFGS